MKDENNKISGKYKLIDEKTNNYRKDFEGLNKNQQVLLAYRKIIELRRVDDLKKELSEKEENNNISFRDLYRLISISEERKDGNYENEDLEKGKNNENLELLSIIEASDYNCGLVQALMLYTTCNSEKEYRDLYKESLISYNEILKNYKLLADELNINSSLDQCHLFTYMLWNGYYSVSKSHCYKLQERLLLPGMYSFDVIKGKGVCLSYSELLHNYLTINNKKSAILSCKVPTKKEAISCDYKPEIERNVKSNISSKVFTSIIMCIFKRMINQTGNHSITLVEENDKLFCYDPTNLFVLNLIDENTASIINGKGNFDIKPLSTLITQSNADPNHLFEKLLYDDIKQAFTRKEIIYSFENIMELIKNNINLLDDAYDNIHSNLEIIDKQTEEIGGRFKALKKLKQNK